MKRIVAYVYPVSGGVADAGPPVPEGEAPGEFERASAGSEEAHSQREPLRIEALLSDVQTQQVLGMLMAQESVSDTRVLIEEMLSRQLSIAEPEAGDLFERIVLEVERQLITQVFDDCEHVKTRAAARLGIDRNTLHKKLRKYNLDREPAERGST
jgi:DNA-binding protein Fis